MQREARGQDILGPGKGTQAILFGEDSAPYPKDAGLSGPRAALGWEPTAWMPVSAWHMSDSREPCSLSGPQ